MLHIFNQLYNYHINFISLFSTFGKIDCYHAFRKARAVHGSSPLERLGEVLVHCSSDLTSLPPLQKSPLLIIAVFIVQFLAIHPFQDGNGRLSRVLTTLLLLRAGYIYAPYASLERVIEENKDLHYKALRRTQTTLKSERPDWEPWLGFFLRCLKKQKDTLAHRLERELVEQEGQSRLPELSSQVLELLKKRERLSAAQIEALTGANRNTLKVRMRELVASGHIRKLGKARATWYSLRGTEQT